MLCVLFSLTNGRRLLPVEALCSVRPLAGCINKVVHYSATQRHLHKPRRCLRHIQYPSDIANSAPTRTIGFSENPQ